MNLLQNFKIKNEIYIVILICKLFLFVRLQIVDNLAIMIGQILCLLQKLCI